MAIAMQVENEARQFENGVLKTTKEKFNKEAKFAFTNSSYFQNTTNSGNKTLAEPENIISNYTFSLCTNYNRLPSSRQKTMENRIVEGFKFSIFGISKDHIQGKGGKFYMVNPLN